MKYPITLKRELYVNFPLHLALGFIIAYSLVPMNKFIWMLVASGVYGIIREVIQRIMKKIQPFYIHVLDVMGLILGAGLWYLIRELFNINANVL